ncbi:MAG: RCC1 domain-containing protein, partial [Clostridia bacterium]
MQDGTVWTWGNNSYGQLGDGTREDSLHPVKVEELSAVAAIEAGNECAMAVRKGGSVWGWGNNFSGQLGFSPNMEDNVWEKPRVIGGCSYVESISIGGGHVLSVKQDRLVKAWGYNSYGQLGIGSKAYNIVENPKQIIIP